MATWPPGPLHITSGDAPPHTVRASRARGVRNQDDRCFMLFCPSSIEHYIR